MSQRQNLRRGGALLVLALLLSGTYAPIVHAADPIPTNPDGAFNLTVSPPSVGIEVNPGASVTTDIRVQNQGIATERVAVSLLKFSGEGETGLPKLQDVQPGDEFAKWIKFSTTSFDALPNEWKTVKVTVSPPKDAAFGYYYAVSFSRAGAEKTVQKSKANLLASVASLVLVDVKSPNAIRRVEVAGFSTDRKSTEFLPIKFNIRLHNTGNTHVASRGTITISRGGSSVASLPVNSQVGYVLPSSYRTFSAEWKDGTPLNKFKADNAGKIIVDAQGERQSYLDWDKFSTSKLRFGKYNARLVMIYNDGKGNTFTEARLSFWVIPWRVIGVITLVALFVLAGIWAIVIRPLRSRLKNRSRNVTR